jgi:hypothetical protein
LEVLPDRASLARAQSDSPEDFMSNPSTTNHGARPADSERLQILYAVGAKWQKFTKQELDALKTRDQLVAEVVAKYGIDQAGAQRDVDALLAGRSLKS